MKKSNKTIGNRTRVLLASSAVPQPTAPPRASGKKVTEHKMCHRFSLQFLSQICSHSKNN